VNLRFSGKRLWQGGLLILFASLFLFLPLPAQVTPRTEHLFLVEASQFAYAPATFQVHPGDRVTIELRSTDVVHGLEIDGYDFSLAAEPGQPASITFIAGKPGTYQMRCSVTCGNLHPFMIGKFKVGTNLLYWRATLLMSLLAVGLVVWKRQ
jgi:heme/copper-type cytochrome/quinol oxidase subunit 2